MSESWELSDTLRARVREREFLPNSRSRTLHPTENPLPHLALLSMINYIVMLNLFQHLTNLALYLILGKIPNQVRDDIFLCYCPAKNVGCGKFLIYRINKIIVSVIKNYQNLRTILFLSFNCFYQSLGIDNFSDKFAGIIIRTQNILVFFLISASILARSACKFLTASVSP